MGREVAQRGLAPVLRVTPTAHGSLIRCRLARQEPPYGVSRAHYGDRVLYEVVTDHHMN